MAKTIVDSLKENRRKGYLNEDDKEFLKRGKPRDPNTGVPVGEGDEKYESRILAEEMRKKILEVLKKKK